MGLKNALVRVTIEPQVPLPDQTQAPLQIICGGAEHGNEDVDGGDITAHSGTFHLVDGPADEVEAVGRGRPGEDEEDTVVGEGVVAEARDVGGAEVEKREGLAGTV